VNRIIRYEFDTLDRQTLFIQQPLNANALKVISLGLIGQPGVQLTQVTAQHLATILGLFAQNGEMPWLDVPSNAVPEEKTL
jgi:hypothetical protein